MSEALEGTEPADERCADCYAGTHPFKCFICEHPHSEEYYRTEATLDEICSMVVGIKLCTRHARELDELQQKREIERAVA